MHEYVSKNFPQLKSYSVGEGRDRRLVVDLAESQTDYGSRNDDNYKDEPENDDDLRIEV
jgi:hypothetical protein